MASTYSGTFYSVPKNPNGPNKGKKYTVVITTASGSGNYEITLGPEAFVTNMDQGANTIYSPVKYQSANVSIVSSNYYYGMYASSPKQNTVTLKDASNNIVWTGYVTPNVYSADYNHDRETWEIECIDGLSVLKYYDYTPVGNSKDFASFTQIINKCLSVAGCYDNWYFSSVTHVEGQTFLTDNLYISEQNFFDEDDKPMKLNEVLEQVCMFCGVTAVSYGNKVVFIDYDALRSDVSTNHSMHIYSVGDNTVITMAKIEDSSMSDSSLYFMYNTFSHTVGKNSYSSTGSTLTLDNVYSKVTVKDNLYEVKSIIPSMFDDEDLVNAMYQNEDNQNWNYTFGQNCRYNTGKKDDAEYYYIKSRYYENKKYDHYYYTNAGVENNSLGPITNGFDASNNLHLNATTTLGASFAKFNIGSGKTSSEAYNNLEYDSFDNYLMLPINYSAVTNKVRVKSKTDFAKPFFMSSSTKLIAKGSMLLQDRFLYPSFSQNKNDTSIGYWPYSGDKFISVFRGGLFGSKVSIAKSLLTLGVKVDIGSNERSFNVPFYPTGQENEWLYENGSKHEIFYKNFDIQDNVNYSDNIKEKGYRLDMQLPANTVYPAKPIVSIYGFDALNTYRPYSGAPMFAGIVACIFIKDFDIIAVDPFEGGKDYNSTDTEYGYVINDSYVQELSPIEFKICTSDGKNLNYSAVAYKNGNTYSFVDKLKNDALNQTQRSEHLLCYRIVNQYNAPTKKLSLHLFENLIRPWTVVTETGTKFIVDSVSYNYSMDTAEVNLVEKK